MGVPGKNVICFFLPTPKNVTYIFLRTATCIIVSYDFLPPPPAQGVGMGLNHHWSSKLLPKKDDMKMKLDNGWPESVEEQCLLLLVLRHYITRQYIKYIKDLK